MNLLQILAQNVLQCDYGSTLNPCPLSRISADHAPPYIANIRTQSTHSDQYDSWLVWRLLLATQHGIPEILVDPEVHEEVGEVVDVRTVVEVARDAPATSESEDERKVADESENKQTRSDFHRFHVLRFCLLRSVTRAVKKM